jgi:hypothetical protein
MKNKWYYPTYINESHLADKGRFATDNIPARTAVVETSDPKSLSINESEDYNLEYVGNNTYVSRTSIAKWEELTINLNKS